MSPAGPASSETTRHVRPPSTVARTASASLEVATPQPSSGFVNATSPTGVGAGRTWVHVVPPSLVWTMAAAVEAHPSVGDPTGGGRAPTPAAGRPPG
jgi:hypothetical protein